MRKKRDRQGMKEEELKMGKERGLKGEEDREDEEELLGQVRN